MPYHYNYIHEDLYPNEEFHLNRINDFEWAFDYYIVPIINPPGFVKLDFEYDPNTLKFKIYGSDSFVNRINRQMELNREFYKNWIDTKHEVKPNFGGWIS